MDFKKDLLLIDLETTGLDVGRHEIIQLAAVLLDKKTLKEKTYFNSFIAPSHWKRRDLESMAVNKISFEQVRKAPGTREVLKEFSRLFPYQTVILSYYVGVHDIIFLQAAYKKAGLPYRFDYHTFNIWSLFLPFLALKNKLTSKKDFAGFGIESMVRLLKIKVDGRMHDALNDCRVEAEILRKIMYTI